MITELQLSNFKSWRELDIKLGRVTGLFGTNSSGKSSILQFLLMLKQTKEATDRGLVLDLGGQNQLVNLGSFKDLIYRHDENNLLKWKLKWDSGEKNKIVYSTASIILYENKQIKIESSSYESCGFYYKISRKNEKFIFESNDYPAFVPNSYYEINNFTLTKTHLFPNELIEQLSFLSFALQDYEYLMDKIYYLAPLREYPQREYRWQGLSRIGVGDRGEYTIDAILAATIRNETRIIPESNEEKPFQEVIACWLKKLGLIYEFKLKEIAEGTDLYRVIVKKEPESTEAFLTDVGFGVSQVLPALVLLYYVPEGSIILMEQPEIHLHPSVQSGLADAILQISKQRNIQVIVESHSEHLLQRFQRRVAEESYPVDELKLYFCDSQQGESKLLDLEIDEFGDIKNYPENFFGDEMAEIAATRIAGLKRKMKEAAKNGE